LFLLVPRAGLEPARSFEQRILSLGLRTANSAIYSQPPSTIGGSARLACSCR
jgi:hypothetical protein